MRLYGEALKQLWTAVRGTNPGETTELLEQRRADDAAKLQEDVERQVVDETIPEGSELGALEAMERGAMAEDAGLDPMRGRTRERNLNLDYLATGQDTDALLDWVARENEGFMAQRRMPSTWEEIRARADAIPTEKGLSDLMRRKPGDLLNAEQLTRARQLMLESAVGIQEYAKSNLAAGEPSDEALYEFRRMLFRHRAIQAQVQGAVSELATAFGMLRDVAGPKNMLWTQRMNEVLEQTGGRDTALQIMRNAAELTDPADVSKLAEASWAMKTFGAAKKWWINWALLSGPVTHMANISSNAVMAGLLNPAERFMAGAAGSLRRRATGAQAGVRTTEATAMLFGTLQSTLEALKGAGDSFVTGQSKFGGKKVDIGLDDASMNSNWGKLGLILHDYVLEAPTRALGAEDEFFKTWGYSAQMAALAVRQASEEGLSGLDLTARVDELMRNPTEEMYSSSVDFARFATFTNELGPRLKRVQGALQGWPGSWLITPFFRTPANLVTWGIDRLPVGKTVGDIKRGFAKEATPEEQALADMAMGRVMMGATIMAATAAAVASGRITGSGPNNYEVQSVWKDTGWLPFAILTVDENGNEHYTSYKRMDPAAIMLGAIVSGVEKAALADDPNALDEIVMGTVVGLADSLTSKQYLAGITNLLEVITETGSTSRLERLLAQTTSTFGSTAMGSHIRRSTDEYAREVEANSFWGEVVNRWKNRIPGWSTDLPPKTGLWGEPLMYGAMGPEFMSPWTTAKASDDPATVALIDEAFAPGKPSCEISYYGNKVDSLAVEHPQGNGWACYEYRKRLGELSHKAVSMLVRPRPTRICRARTTACSLTRPGPTLCVTPSGARLNERSWSS